MPDHLVCKTCQLASRDPHLSMCCGHIFCKSCVDGVKKSNYTTCPILVCRNKAFSTVLNKQIDRKVKDFTILCSSKRAGCLWEGKFLQQNLPL